MKQLKKMKKKRKIKKGFTLVELLAVIVILAIVVGITLVTVLPTLKTARQEAFELSAETAADYLEKQYELSVLGNFGDNSSIEIPAPGNWAFMTKEQLQEAGLKPENYVLAQWYIDKNTNRICLELLASTEITEAAGVYNLDGKIESGDYYDATEGGYKHYGSVKVESGKSKNNQYSIAKSSGCK